MTGGDEPRELRVGLVQMRMGDDVAENRDKALRMTREAAAGGAQVVCLPELFTSRYFCQTEDAGRFALAEPVPGPLTTEFAGLAAEFDITVVLSIFERRAAGLYHNTAAVVDRDRGYIGKYRKMHIPDDPRYYEKYYFTPGDLGFKSFATDRARLGVLICWDQWYPEAARLTALQGAEILFYPTAIGWHPEEKDKTGAAQHEAWELSQRAHAVANGCFVAAVNRTGFEPAGGGDGGIEFWGRSFVAAPDGSLVCRAPADTETVLIAGIDLTRIETQRQGWPFLRDRRIDAYGAIAKRFDDR
ncbi:MAG TPA: carbon-nitrogen hydrolase [Gammaproteobacteria bacterium]|nr:carbon-nitrogen hydrolase [Gammaproteobacteria bacterium]